MTAAAITTRTDIGFHDKVFNDLFLSHSGRFFRLSETVPGYGMNTNTFDIIARKDVPEIEDSPLHAVGNPSFSILFTLFI